MWSPRNNVHTFSSPSCSHSLAEKSLFCPRRAFPWPACFFAGDLSFVIVVCIVHGEHRGISLPITSSSSSPQSKQTTINSNAAIRYTPIDTINIGRGLGMLREGIHDVPTGCSKLEVSIIASSYWRRQQQNCWLDDNERTIGLALEAISILDSCTERGYCLIIIGHIICI